MLTMPGATADDKTLSAFYDLAVTPNTFDIFVFLALADVARREAGCDALHLYVVPGPHGGFRHDADLSDLPAQQYMLRNVVLGAPALMPTCAGVTACSTREMAERILYAERRHGGAERVTFPAGYSVHLPAREYHLWRLVERWQNGVEVPTLEPPAHAIRLVEAWLRTRCGRRKVITITLRECRRTPERNSNLSEWARLVAALDPREYAIVLLRDLECVHEPLPAGFAACHAYPEAVVSLELRGALYRRAYLNLCVNNGPVLMLFLDRAARYLCFKMVTESASSTTTVHHRTSHWLERGDDVHFATPFQRLVWEDDQGEVLCREVAAMCALIESGRYGTPGAVEAYVRGARERWIARLMAAVMDQVPAEA